MDTELLNFVSERLDQALRSAEILSKHQYKENNWQVEILHGFNSEGHTSSSILITTSIYAEEYGGAYGGGYEFELPILEGTAIAEMLINPEYGRDLTIENIEHTLSRHQLKGAPYWIYFEPTNAFIGNESILGMQELRRKTDISSWNPKLGLGDWSCNYGYIYTAAEARAIVAALLTQK